jgi:tRNA 2-thiouridine synthesizing protein A
MKEMGPKQAEEGEAETVLDAKGLMCPLPVLKAGKAMKGVPPGGLLRILATDPKAPGDFAHFCDKTGYALVSSTDEAGLYVIEIRKT